MKPKNQSPAGSDFTEAEPPIFNIRGRRVMLDADLARIYGVTTSRFNEAFKRNKRRFPEDFVFQLTDEELSNLRSQIAILGSGLSLKDQTLWSQIVTTSGQRRWFTHRPWAFTEHGAIMAANILRSDRAIQMSIYVVRAVIRMREQIAAHQTILKRLAEIDKTLLQQDGALRDIYRKILPLLEPPPEKPPKRKMGFHREG